MSSKNTPGQHIRTILITSLFQALALYPLLALAAAASPAREPPKNSNSDSHPAFSNFFAHGHAKRASGACKGFDGDQDTYGLGIRIGLYFQWVTSSIAYQLVPTEAVTMRGVNNCFQLAMFAGLLYITIQKGAHDQLHAIEAYLVLLFCMGGVCSGTSEIDDEIGSGGSRTAQKGFAYLEASTLGGIMRVLLFCGFVGYGLWFFFVGMDGMLEAFPDDCGYVFFFASVPLAGWFRTFMKVMFVFAAVVGLFSLVFSMGIVVKETFKFVFDEGWKGRVGSSQEPYEEEKPGLQSHGIQKGNFTCSGGLLLFIISVELIIKWNKIEGVGNIGSTGQLLPVIIGVAGVGRVALRFLKDLLEEWAMERDRRRARNIRTVPDSFGIKGLDTVAISTPTPPPALTGNPGTGNVGVSSSTPPPAPTGAPHPGADNFLAKTVDNLRFSR